MLDIAMKQRHQKALETYRYSLWEKPRLRQLFLELTQRCNEHCLHCGSRCGEEQHPEELTAAQYHRFLDEIKTDFGTEDKMLCITGGEPLLRQDFEEIMGYAHDLGFRWGMTSNATLIDDAKAQMLQRCGMNTISVSIDGLEETHDRFRRTPGGWKRAMDGIDALLRVGFDAVQVTTVVTHQNIGELDALFAIFDGMDIDSWRIINIEPMGRALEHPELLLTPEDYRYLFQYIRDKRIAGEPVCYGCSHYLGMEYEREVRDWYFHCIAGTFVASITTTGDIIACLDIDRRPELVQGNILRDRFKDVWENRFQAFRRDLAEENERCRSCPDKHNCHGDSFHSWNFEKQEPRLCLRGILFNA